MGDSTFSGGWIFAFLIIAVIFGWGNGGFGGNNAAMAGFATTAEVQNSINSAFAQQNAQNILLSSANNNYETSQLISNQNMQMMNQSNSNLINAIQGYNQLNTSVQGGFANVSAQIADLGYRMENCCCSIKTMMLENRLADVQAKLVSSENANAIFAQNQYLLSQLGTYTPV